MRTSLIILAASLFALSGCRGKVLATAELHGEGSADVDFESTGAPVFLWADTDGKWTGGSSETSKFPVHYEIDVKSKGTVLGHISCDTKDTSTSVCGTKVSEGTSHHGDCEYKLACAVPSIPAGPASLHVTGTPGKQASDIKKMSVNVRDK